MQDQEPMPEDAWVTTRLAHLQMLQDSIERMSATSGHIKVAGTAMVTAVLSVATGVTNPNIALVALPVIILLATLDAYYLSLERGFRNKFNALRVTSIQGLADFAMQPDNRLKLPAVLTSRSIWPFYASLLAIVIATSIVVDQAPPQRKLTQP
jgi:glucan phosphoethanolaminetransferase (alkaline phosphatase superfamily)